MRKIVVKKSIVLGIIILFLGASNVPSIAKTIDMKPSFPLARGDTLYVGGSGPGNYSKIQDAIDNASSGDTVFVYSGIYSEHLLVNKIITLTGEKKELTIIDGSHEGIVCHIQPPATLVNINNFTITNGQKGVIFNNSGDNTISDCLIKSHVASGIYLENSNTNIISRCTVTGNGGNGIYLTFSSNNVIKDMCEISNNEGRGIFLYDDCDNNQITNKCDISNNGGTGIVLIWSANSNVIQYCNISNNDYGITLSYSDDNTIIYCTFFNNNKEGIFIQEYSSGMEIHHNNFVHNNGGGKQVMDYGPSPWDDGYPSGGNYWSDFDEASEGAYDEFSGPYQNLSGKDGIVDLGFPDGGRNPYGIPNKNAKDWYPFITYAYWNHAPNIPSDPLPENGALDISVTTYLGWLCNDIDGDPLTYDVYFGNTNPPPKVSSNQSYSFYNPGLLDSETTYYWRIVAWDPFDASSSGSIWNFTTESLFIRMFLLGLIKEKNSSENTTTFTVRICVYLDLETFDWAILKSQEQFIVSNKKKLGFIGQRFIIGLFNGMMIL